jgi:small subunit ribosomal protein S30e
MPTHGSLTKAGKVRGQTPKIEGKKRTSLNPRVKGKRAFRNRVIFERNPGQRWESRKPRHKK